MSAPEVLYSHSELEVAPKQHTLLPKPYDAAPYYDVAPQNTVPNYYDQKTFTPERKEQRICGLRTTTFFLSLALLLVILASAIGGGVGGTMAVNNAKNSSNKATSTSNNNLTSTITTTIFAPSPTSSSSSTTITVPKTGLLSLDCPRINNSQLPIKLSSSSNSLFNVTCGQDFRSDFVDILAVIAYSLEDCARACASYNQQWGKASVCRAARFDGNLGHLSNHDGTCWLKNGTGTVLNYGDSTSAGLVLV